MPTPLAISSGRTALGRALLASGLNKQYLADIRSDTVVRHPEMLRQWKEAGLRAVIIGFEEIDDASLSAMNKANQASMNAEAIAILNDLGITIVGDFIISPDYDEADFDRLEPISAARRIDLPMITVMTPLPGTAPVQEEQQRIINHNLDYYTLTNAVTPTKLDEKRFYTPLCRNSLPTATKTPGCRSMNAFITAVSAFLPGQPVGNDDLERYLGKVDRIAARTRQIILANNGIETRHYAIDPETGATTHSNAQLAAEAVRRLYLPAGTGRSAFECLCCGTSSPDQLMPGHASMVHGELGVGPCEVVSTAGICLSGITALKYGAMSVALGLTNSAVATGSELAVHLHAQRLFSRPCRGRSTSRKTRSIIRPFPLRRNFCAGCSPTAPERS